MGPVKKIPLVLFILLILAVWAGPFVWRSDFFQKTFYPRDYWQKQVEGLQELISLNDSIIRSTYRDLQKIQLTASLEVADAVDTALTAGVSREIAINQAMGEIRQKVEENRILIKELSDDNVKLKQDLEKAKAELAKHK